MVDKLKEQATDYLNCGIVKYGENDYSLATCYLDAAIGLASEDDIEFQREINEWLFKSCFESAKGERAQGLLAEAKRRYGEALAYFNVAAGLVERSAEAEEKAFSSSSESDFLRRQIINDHIRVEALYDKANENAKTGRNR